MNWRITAVQGKPPLEKKLWNYGGGKQTGPPRWYNRLWFPSNNSYHSLWYSIYFINFPCFRGVAAVITQNPSPALPISARRETSEDRANTCWEPSACSVRRQKTSQHLTQESEVTPPLWGATTLLGPLAANPQWVLLPKGFLYSASWKKITTELTSPIKIHDSGKSLRDQVFLGGGGVEHKLIQESKTSFAKAF